MAGRGENYFSFQKKKKNQTHKPLIIYADSGNNAFFKTSHIYLKSLRKSYVRWEMQSEAFLSSDDVVCVFTFAFLILLLPINTYELL